jgi:MoaA/NifB/PqqE/SkfB family radical SAM enzyme
VTFRFDTVTEYQLEITSYCNAACPQCPRNINGSRINPHMPLRHLDRHVINRAFDPVLVQRMRQVFFCGSYGDPIMHPEFANIVADFRDKNPALWIYAHSNGGVHDAAWWQDLAGMIGSQGAVDFGIDGLADTLDLYRRNVDFDRVIQNARAFIKAGGRAQWTFIVFEHNQHQIKEAQQLAADLGFHRILFRSTGRFLDHASMTEMPEWPVEDRRAQREYVLRPTTLDAYRNRSILNSSQVAETREQWHRYFDTTAIRCDALMGNKVAINCEGMVLPCNFFNHNLYDARFHDRASLPGAHDLAFKQGRNAVRVFLESYGLDNLNIHHRSLPEIFDCEMWQDLQQSWQAGFDRGRLFECAFSCGERFTKTWDQTPV